MNKELYFLTFAAGAIIGGLAAWTVSKNRYEEEIESVKSEFTKRWDERNRHDDRMDKLRTTLQETTEQAMHETDISKKESTAQPVQTGVNDQVDYRRTIQQQRYTPMEPQERPYVIMPDEVGEFEDYDVLTLFYYDDGILADEAGQIVEDINGVTGGYTLDHFGEYEDDTVYVRNDRLKCDYEILKDARNYFGDIKK